MATKKPSKPVKFRQARKQGKTDAKKTFSGKFQAIKKDPTSQLAKEDTEALKEMDAVRKAQKKGQTTYQTTDRGEKVFTKASEVRDYQETRDAEARRALEKFREETYGTKEKTPAKETKPSVAKKAAPVKKSAPAAKKSATAPKKFVAKTEAAKAPAKTGITRAEKSAANKAAWAKMTPAERKNWSANKPTSGLSQRQEANIQRKFTKEEQRMAKLRAADPAKFAAREKIATNTKLTPEQKVAGIEKIGKTIKPKPAAPAKSGKYLDMQNAKKVSSVRTNVPKVNPNYAVAVRPKAGEVVAKEAAKKAGKKVALKLALKAVPVVGTAMTAAEIANIALKKKGKSGPTLQQYGESLDKNGKPKKKVTTPVQRGAKAAAQDAAYRAKKNSLNGTSATAGGSTTRWTVKKGDTLSSIASANKTSLAALREANPTLMNNPKYKKGSMLWAGTKVNLKKK